MQHLKVGDWVRSTKYKHLKPMKIKSIYESNTRPGILGLRSGGSVLYSDEVKLWVPEPGEWCWFMNKDRIPTLSQFVEFHEDTNKYFATYPNKPNSFGAYYTKCEPFIGKLPSDLKGFNK